MNLYVVELLDADGEPMPFKIRVENYLVNVYSGGKWEPVSILNKENRRRVIKAVYGTDSERVELADHT